MCNLADQKTPTKTVGKNHIPFPYCPIQSTKFTRVVWESHLSDFPHSRRFESAAHLSFWMFKTSFSKSIIFPHPPCCPDYALFLNNKNAEPSDNRHRQCM